MSFMLVLEAAGRSLLMGMIIWLVLRSLRVRQVHAQRTAWLLALAGALSMPLLASLRIGPQILPATAAMPAQLQGMPAGHIDGGPALYFVGVYLAVSALLLARLGWGVAAAWNIVRRARPIDSDMRFPNLPQPLDVRISKAVAAPVTIGSGIVLPENHTQWPQDRLRIVLGHESAHVRQKDFHVQLLAQLHCALFWFSPFSWWLRRELSDLGEALSDHAAVQQAGSRATYAEVLLSFADPCAPAASVPSAAVAMARRSNLSARIERLLSDRFHQCFANRSRNVFIAALAALISLGVATSVTRVQAAATHGWVDSDEMYAANDTLPEPDTLPKPPQAPSAPPAPRSRTVHGDAFGEPARELARAQAELARESANLAREHAALSAELSAQLSAEFARAQRQLAAAQGQAAHKMRSAQIESLREEAGSWREAELRLGRQMGQLAEQQRKLIEQAMQELQASWQRVTREGLAAPEN